MIVPAMYTPPNSLTFSFYRYDACDMNVYRSALSIGLIEGLPNVRQFTWPRDCDLPPPSLPPSEQSNASVPAHLHRGGMVVQQQRNNQQGNDIAVQAALPPIPHRADEEHAGIRVRT